MEKDYHDFIHNIIEIKNLEKSKVKIIKILIK